ncbi:MAG: bifunctional oligoribonuclease/PAP phosphatase NrnA [Planctomycetota bacterium]|nr:MAG: bifunctional oligoribonuclease/PAP phosphatase NrnA [Planctomycetota bacterium]REJ92319.1 MAG: bifunctional oligoribonuclease/PAP phosphatase NrnA [Planctomycetota bacterium]
MSIDWSRFREIVAAHQKFIVTSHIRADCDALGSMLGLAAVLEAVGKETITLNGDGVPPNLAFIDPEQRIKTLGEGVTAADLAAYEVLIICDTSAFAQLGPLADVVRETAAKKVLIDHHVGEDELGAEIFKSTKAAATGHLIVEAAEALDVELTESMATPLYAALATDTGWFRFNSVTPATMEVGAKLVAAGARPQEIYTALYEQDSLARLKLRGMIIARTETLLDGRLAYTSVLLDDLKKTGAVPTDTEDVINLTLGVRGVESAVIFVERREGDFKLSFRSRGGLDCSAVAQHFGGGGHKAAAGAYIPGPLAAAQKTVLDYVCDAMG